jgi:anti-sigma factor RsiW
MLVRVRSIACRQAVELVTAYLEETLSRRDRRRFEAHIADCPHCHEYLDQMKITLELTGAIKEEDLDPQVQEDLILIFRQWKGDS